MRPLVLLLFVVPAILHAYPQQSDRRHIEAVAANAPSRGSRKYNPREEQLVVESLGAWHPERTERRQSSEQLPPQQSAPNDRNSAVKSRKRTSSRSAVVHVPEPESASSVKTQVTHQLISPRTTYHERQFATEETTIRSEGPRQHIDNTLTSRHISAAGNNSKIEHGRTQMNSRKSEGHSAGFSRRSQDRRNSSLSVEFPRRSEGPSEKSSRNSQIRRNSTQSAESPHMSEGPSSDSSRNSQNRKESALYAEAPRISGRRGVFTGGRWQQSSPTSGIAQVNVRHSASLQSLGTETPSLSPLTESSKTFQVVHERGISAPVSNTAGVPVHLGLKQALLVTDAPEPVSIKRVNLLEMRRIDDLGRSGRKLSSPQIDNSRNRNGVANSVSDSVSSGNTRHHNRRPSNYISKLPEVSSSAFALSDSSPTDIPRIGFTRRTTTAEFTPREANMRSTPTSASHQNVAEVGAQVNEPRSRGQFRNRSRELAGTERSTETRQQRTYRRTSLGLDGSRNKLSADAMTNSQPQTSAKNLGGETLSRSSDVTQKPLKSRDGSRRNHSRGEELEIVKSAPSWERSEDIPQSQPSVEEEVKKLQKQDMLKIMRNSEEEETHADDSTDLEESFITRSSQQVVSVSVHPSNTDQVNERQSSASIDHKSRGESKASGYNTVKSKAVFIKPSVTTDVNKIKPRTANFLLAPTPPTKSTDTNVGEIKGQKTEAIGEYSQLQNSKLSKTEAKDSNSEGNKLITTLPPFTRYSSRKCAATTDEKNFNKCSSTSPRGKSYEATRQETSAVPATKIQQHVLTSTSAPSAPNSGISHTSRSEFKLRLASMRENLSPSSISAVTKAQPQFSSVPTAKKLPDSHVPTLDTGKGGSSRTNKVSVVTSQSFVANIPRFSSRYRSELLRGTGHGSRGSSTPVYVPTVPTVSTTSTTEQTMFSDKHSDALNPLDVADLSTPSILKHTITPQHVHATSPPNKGPTLTSTFHTSKGALESKNSFHNIKSSVLSVSVQQSITGNASPKRLDNGSKPIAQQFNPLSNNYSSPDIWNLHKNLNNSEIISVLSTKISPNRDILSANNTIKNAETTDSSDFSINSETTFKSRQYLLTNSPLTAPVKTAGMSKQMASPTPPPNLKFSSRTMSNQSAETKIPKLAETGTSAASVTSTLTKENNPYTHKNRNWTAMPLQTKILGNNLFSDFYDVIFPSSTEFPPSNTIKTTTPALTVTDSTSARFARRLTPAPKGTMSSTTSRVVRVREIKGGPEPSVTPVSTVTDSYVQRIPPGAIHQSNDQAQAATEVPTLITTTDFPHINKELTISNMLTLDLPTTTLETLSSETTTMSTTNIKTTTLPSYDLPPSTELLTIDQMSTIPTTTNIPTTTYPLTTSLPKNTDIHTSTVPVTTTLPTSTDIQTVTVPIMTTIPTTTAIQTTTVLTTTTIPTPTDIQTTTVLRTTTVPTPATATPSIAPSHVTTPSIITIEAAVSNIKPIYVTQTTTAAIPRAFTTTLRTPAPYVIFGIYPNGTVFRKIPNSNFKEQVHENEIARRNPFYPDHRYFSTNPPAPAQYVGRNEVAPLAPSFDDGFNSGRNEIQDEDAQVLQLPLVTTVRPQQRPQQPSGPTEAPAQTSGFALGNLISSALGIDPHKGVSPSARAEFLASVMKNSNIIIANTTAATATPTTTTTTTTVATATTKSAPQPTVPSTTATPKTTVNPVAGVLDDFSLLNILLMGRPPDASPRPGRNQGSSIANRIIQVALSRGTSSSKKPATPTPKVTITKPTTVKTTNLNITTAAPNQPTVKQNQEDMAGLLKLLESMEYTTKGSLTPSEQLLADFLAKQATSQPSQRNLSNQIRIQDILNPPVKDKREKNLKPSSTTTALPGQLLGELFNPLFGVNQGDNKIRDPRAGQGLVEAAISATKVVSQLMGSVFEGASKSLQSFVKSLAWGSGEASG